MHKCRDDISGLLGVGMSVVVDSSSVAFYPCDRVADDGLEKNAVGRPLVAVRHLLSQGFTIECPHGLQYQGRELQ